MKLEGTNYVEVEVASFNGEVEIILRTEQWGHYASLTHSQAKRLAEAIIQATKPESKSQQLARSMIEIGHA